MLNWPYAKKPNTLKAALIGLVLYWFIYGLIAENIMSNRN